MTKAVTMAQVADKVVDKTDVMVQKAVETAGNIFEAASNLVSKGIEQYGQQAMDAVLWVVRVDAIQSLVYGWVLFGVILGIFIWSWKKIGAFRSSDDRIYSKVILSTVCAILMVAFSFPKITDVWLYTAVVKPELYLVKQAVDIVKKKALKAAQ